MTRAFWKMHGLGNDFVVFDGRKDGFCPDDALARRVADRHFGLGCDQVITLRPSDKADIFMHIRNADGSEVGACGNATRCVAKLVLEETGGKVARIETQAAVLEAVRTDGQFRIDMGVPGLNWDEIPLSYAMDTQALDYAKGPLERPCAVSMGNPHLIFFVEDAMAVDLAALGPQVEHDTLFPARTNVSVAQIEGSNVVRLRVWERGAGITLACGTAACATAVAACRRGLADRNRPILIDLDGGQLSLLWDTNDHVIMTGPATMVASGQIDLDALEVRS